MEVVIPSQTPEPFTKTISIKIPGNDRTELAFRFYAIVEFPQRYNSFVGEVVVGNIPRDVAEIVIIVSIDWDGFIAKTWPSVMGMTSSHEYGNPRKGSEGLVALDSDRDVTLLRHSLSFSAM